MRIEIREEGIFWPEYFFAPASVYPSGLLKWEDIAEVGLKRWPREVRTTRGEVLFVDPRDTEAFKAVASTHRLPLVERQDVWLRICCPALDTDYTTAYTTADDTRMLTDLEVKSGVSRLEVDAMRARVLGPLSKLNYLAMLFEEAHLGHYEVLHALAGTAGEISKVPDHKKLTPEEFSKFYWESMALAMRGAVMQATSGEDASQQ